VNLVQAGYASLLIVHFSTLVGTNTLVTTGHKAEVAKVFYSIYVKVEA